MVYTDACEKHKQFKSKHNFTVIMLLDSDKKLIDKYGAKNDKGMYLRHIMIFETSG